MKTSLKSSQFKSVFKNSNIYNFNNIRFLYKESSFNAIGFIVGRKLGSSVERNGFKRKCRAEFSELIRVSNKFLNLIVYPQKKIIKNKKNINLAFEKLKKEFCD